MKSRFSSPVASHVSQIRIWSTIGSVIGLGSMSLLAGLGLSMGAAVAQATLTVPGGSGALTLEGSSVPNLTCASNVKDYPNHTLEILEDSDRRFKVKGGSDMTLLVINGQGKRFCVQTDEFSGGEAELPGRWKKGSYRVYVGGKAPAPYRFSVLPIN